MSERTALMLAIMEPPPGLEEEFNDWYDTEHLPQRRGLPQFLSATRWVCIAGFPRSLAAYDLASLAALEHPAYRAVSGAASTPWSKRILARTARTGRMRVEAEQVWPGTAMPLRSETVSRMLVARYHEPAARTQAAPGAIVAEARDRFATLPQLGQLRLFTSVADTGSQLWALAEFRAPISIDALSHSVGDLDGRGADVFNLYVPYSKAF